MVAWAQVMSFVYKFPRSGISFIRAFARTVLNVQFFPFLRILFTYLYTSTSINTPAHVWKNEINPSNYCKIIKILLKFITIFRSLNCIVIKITFLFLFLIIILSNIKCTLPLNLPYSWFPLFWLILHTVCIITFSYIFYVYRYLIVCKWYYKLDWDFRLLNFVYIFSNGISIKRGN